MKIFSSHKELAAWVSLSGLQRQCLTTCFHESGHTLLALHYNAKFTHVWVGAHVLGYPHDAGGQLDILPEQDITKRQYITIALGGWAAEEIFHSAPRYLSDPPFEFDAEAIVNTPGSNPEVVGQQQREAKQILSGKIKELKKLAFELFRRKTLTYEEVRAIVI